MTDANFDPQSENQQFPPVLDATPSRPQAPVKSTARRRFFGTGVGMAAAAAALAAGVARMPQARAAGEKPPTYRVPGYRDLYRGEWEKMVAKGSTDSLYGRKILKPSDFNHGTVVTKDPRGYDVKFHYVREGKGEPLFLFHGWPGFWWDYWMNIKELAKHFDVIAVDMRGYGESDKPGYNSATNRIDLDPVDHYDLNTTVDDHMRVAKALGIEKAYWCGHDWASLTMHKFVRRYPEMVKKLILANPFLPGAEARYLSPAFHSHSYYASFHSTPLATELVGSSREATISTSAGSSIGGRRTRRCGRPRKSRSSPITSSSPAMSKAASVGIAPT